MMRQTGMDPLTSVRVAPTAAEQVEGLGLFAPPAGTPLRRMNETSRAAGVRAMATAPTKRAVIRQVIAAAGGRGITRKEAAEATGFSKDTVNARMRELLDDPREAVVEMGRREAESVVMEWQYAGGRR